MSIKKIIVNGEPCWSYDVMINGGILKIPKIYAFFRVFSPFSALFMTVFTSILYILPIFCQYFCNKKGLMSLQQQSSQGVRLPDRIIQLCE